MHLNEITFTYGESAKRACMTVANCLCSRSWKSATFFEARHETVKNSDDEGENKCEQGPGRGVYSSLLIAASVIDAGF